MGVSVHYNAVVFMTSENLVFVVEKLGAFFLSTQRRCQTVIDNEDDCTIH